MIPDISSMSAESDYASLTFGLWLFVQFGNLLYYSKFKKEMQNCKLNLHCGFGPWGRLHAWSFKPKIPSGGTVSSLHVDASLLKVFLHIPEWKVFDSWRKSLCNGARPWNIKDVLCTWGVQVENNSFWNIYHVWQDSRILAKYNQETVNNGISFALAYVLRGTVAGFFLCFLNS